MPFLAALVAYLAWTGSFLMLIAAASVAVFLLGTISSRMVFRNADFAARCPVHPSTDWRPRREIEGGEGRREICLPVVQMEKEFDGCNTAHQERWGLVCLWVRDVETRSAWLIVWLAREGSFTRSATHPGTNTRLGIRV